MAGTELARALTAGLMLLCVAAPGSVSVDARAASSGSRSTGFEGCESQGGALCRYVSVPLDYSNATPGRVRLFVTKREARGTPKGTILLLAGGPGEASAQSFTLTSDLWGSLFPGYTVAAYDNRGTGASDPLTCAPSGTAARCARAIGRRRVFYGTRENAEDVESVRRALGVDRIALFGISYGTKQALAYAREHPDHVERLLLDSAVPVNDADPFDLASLEAISTALGSICHGGACAEVSGNPASDFAKLANRLDAKPLVARAKVYVDQWTPRFRAVRLDGLGLLALARASDVNPGVAVGLPAAVRAALGGRTGALARMAALVASEPPADVNHAVFRATTCNDGPFPWHRDTPVAKRRSVLANAVASLPRRSLGRYGSWAAVGSALACLDWPTPTGVEAADASPLPDVPVLVLAGDRDVRTPLRTGAEVAAGFPRGRLLVAPGIGHTVVASSRCVDAAIRTWMRGGVPPARCPRVPMTIDPVALAPRTVSAASALGPRGGVIARTLGATVATLRGAEAAWLTSYPSGWVVGLESGLLAGENFDVFRFSAYSDIPGLAISGRLSFTVSPNGALVPGSEHGIVQVGGAGAANGFLQVKRRRIFGLLDGRRVSARF
jgi:pimeloyl-ACP methyl ester carboxylesterase